MLPSTPVHSFFLRMYQNVDLETPNVSAISLRDFFLSLHFNSISIISFKIPCGSIQGQNYDNSVAVQIFIDQTVLRQNLKHMKGIEMGGFKRFFRHQK